MTTKLKLYNKALGTYVGTQRLATLVDDVSARYALDAVYDDTLKYMLKRGLWKFALRTVRLDHTLTAPLFHRQYAFAKPEDFVRIARISPDARLDAPLINYREDGDYIYEDIDPIFLQYVSNDPEWGGDPDRWPEAYVDAVAARLAFNSALEISKDRGDRADLDVLARGNLDTARRQEAVDDPVKEKPPGRFTRSRFVGGSTNGTLRGLR